MRKKVARIVSKKRDYRNAEILKVNLVYIKTTNNKTKRS